MLTIFLAALVLQQMPTPPPAPTTGTAVLRGQVTDRDSGLPIARAVVTVRMMRNGPPLTWQNFTDSAGRFEFVNLPAGRVNVSASPGEHRATHAPQGYGDRGTPIGPGGSITLTDGELRTDVNIALARAYAISGRLVDEDGLPLAGMSVSALARRGGGYINRSVLSDDRGMFRIFGVTPGAYAVCANPAMGPRMPSATYTARPQRHMRTCHPSALAEADAEPVTVATFDVDGVEVRVRRDEVYSISGSIVDANGELVPGTMLSVGRSEVTGSGSMSMSFTVPAQDGRFDFSGVAPGDYVLQAVLAGTEGRTEQRGTARITIAAADVAGIVIPLRGPATVSGHIIFEDGAPPVSEVRMTVSAIVDRSMPGAGRFVNVQPATVADDHTFTLNGVFGRLRLEVQGLRGEWIVKSIRYRGEDITDTAAEFSTDPRQRIEIVVTTRAAQVSGQVLDESLKPATDALVTIIPADPARRRADAFRLVSVPAVKDGRFTFGRLRPGEYILVALPRGQYEQMPRLPDMIDVLAKYGERISLVENDRMTMNLRVVTLPDPR